MFKFRLQSAKPEVNVQSVKCEVKSQATKFDMRPKIPTMDKFEECPICGEMIASKSSKIFSEHVNVCIDRNTDESDIYKNENNNVIGSTQMVTRARRSYTPNVLKKPRTAPKRKRSKRINVGELFPQTLLERSFRKDFDISQKYDFFTTKIKVLTKIMFYKKNKVLTKNHFLQDTIPYKVLTKNHFLQEIIFYKKSFLPKF